MEIIIKKKDGDTKLTFVNKCVSIIKYVFISNSLALFIIIIIILLLLLLIQTF
jgi:hypothetical protein